MSTPSERIAAGFEVPGHEPPTVLPWHREAAEEYNRRVTDEMNCYTPQEVDLPAIIACHDPHAAQQALPVIHIECETKEEGITGSTHLNVIRVEQEDDNSFTAVTDYWPLEDQRKAQHAETVRLLEEVLRLTQATSCIWYSSPIMDEIRAHLAELREPATLQPATAATKEVAK